MWVMRDRETPLRWLTRLSFAIDGLVRGEGAEAGSLS